MFEVKVLNEKLFVLTQKFFTPVSLFVNVKYYGLGFEICTEILYLNIS